MKKLIVLLVAVCISLLLSACRTQNDIRGDGFSTSSEIHTSNPKNENEGYTFPSINENVYESEFIGIGCEFDDEWMFYDEQQIRELNSTTIDVLDDAYAEKIKSAKIIYDMHATHSDGRSSINVNLEKIGNLEVAKFDLEKKLDEVLPKISDSLSNMGYSDVTYAPTTVKIADKELAGAEITAVLEEYTLTEKLIFIVCDEYVANITVSAFDTNVIEKVLGNIYFLD